MNLTGQEPYSKGTGNRRARQPNAEERRHWQKVRAIGCILKAVWGKLHTCKGHLTKHHAGTGAGGRKDHMKVLPLCWEYHLGDNGINSLTGKISRREWESRNGTEEFLLQELDTLLTTN